MSVKCNNCGSENPDGVTYCTKCNSQLTSYDSRATLATQNPRATVVAADSRTTVRAGSPRTNVVDAKTSSSFNYLLKCMDDSEGNVLTLSTQSQLNLKVGEVLLIAGLRYKVM